MKDIVERLRHDGVEFHEQLEAAAEIERLTGLLENSEMTVAELLANDERLRADITQAERETRELIGRATAEHIENIQLRAALRRIVDEADSDNGLTAWDGADIARAALEPKS